VRVTAVVVASQGTEDETAHASEPAVAPAFEQFYTAEYVGLVRVVSGITGRVDVAEELAQEAFLAAHQRWERISRYDNPRAWMLRVVLNRATSASRRRLTEARLLARLPRQVPAPMTSSEDAADLWREVRRLPARQVQVLALMFVEDLSAAEIGRILGCSEDTVRTHLRRARLTLAARLGVEEPD